MGQAYLALLFQARDGRVQLEYLVPRDHRAQDVVQLVGVLLIYQFLWLVGRGTGNVPQMSHGVEGVGRVQRRAHRVQILAVRPLFRVAVEVPRPVAVQPVADVHGVDDVLEGQFRQPRARFRLVARGEPRLDARDYLYLAAVLLAQRLDVLEVLARDAVIEYQLALGTLVVGKAQVHVLGERKDAYAQPDGLFHRLAGGALRIGRITCVVVTVYLHLLRSFPLSATVRHTLSANSLLTVRSPYRASSASGVRLVVMTVCLPADIRSFMTV